MSVLLQYILDPLVLALALCPGSRGDSRVQLVVDAHVEATGSPLARLDAASRAGIEKDLQGQFPLAAQTLDIRGVRIGTAVQADEVAAEQSELGIVADGGLAAANIHHVPGGATPWD